jgi:hypothetical protein
MRMTSTERVALHRQRKKLGQRPVPVVVSEREIRLPSGARLRALPGLSEAEMLEGRPKLPGGQFHAAAHAAAFRLRKHSACVMRQCRRRTVTSLRACNDGENDRARDVSLQPAKFLAPAIVDHFAHAEGFWPQRQPDRRASRHRARSCRCALRLSELCKCDRSTGCRRLCGNQTSTAAGSRPVFEGYLSCRVGRRAVTKLKMGACASSSGENRSHFTDGCALMLTRDELFPNQDIKLDL